MKVLITGANGFVGKNLRLHLAERKDVEVICFTREHSLTQLQDMIEGVDFVFHLAGVNRPQDPNEFVRDNADFTNTLCGAISTSGRKIPIVYTSSTQAVLDNPYGLSKRTAENALFDLACIHGNPVHVFRLPNVFGKWCKPNYNSVVATFCYNIARDLPIQINDSTASLTLVYVDDVVDCFIKLMNGTDCVVETEGFKTVSPQYTISVGELASQIQTFKGSRLTLVTERVGAGLGRALYSTYVSYFPTSLFTYQVPHYNDPRGAFVEMLKTPDCGQFSYFSAHPGITRGGHYHHSKTEKFLVIRGHARFKFRHVQTGETYEIFTAGDKAEIVETIPGWAHDITNIGSDEMIVLLWANEVFDRAKPDTYTCPL